VTVRKVRGGKLERTVHDAVVTEEPMEIRLITTAEDGTESAPLSVSVTMRTPGHDFELAAGFLYSEGVVPSAHAVARIAYCTDPGVEQEHNIVNVTLQPGVAFGPERLARNFYTASSCGICGKASLEAIHIRGCPILPSGGIQVAADLIPRLPDALREAQRVFDRTGGLHAAGLFDARGGLAALREDVGRHNALDKLVGQALLAGRLPLSESVLVLSGRAGFELVQKALVAGIPIVVSVGAPSSLAVDLARDFNLTLVGFARADSFNVYTGHERIAF
jgi:FdhD protein